MKAVNFTVGNYREYALNGDENNTIRIDVSDVSLVKRFKEAAEEIENFGDKLNFVGDELQAFAKADAKAREIVNGIFGEDVCSKAFGGKNCMSTASNGKPILINFLDAFVPVVIEDIKSAVQTVSEDNDKTKKYTSQIDKPIVHSSAAEMVSLSGSALSSHDIDLSALTQEQKNAVIMELLK